jgi:hypothetical protein
MIRSGVRQSVNVRHWSWPFERPESSRVNSTPYLVRGRQRIAPLHAVLVCTELKQREALEAANALWWCDVEATQLPAASALAQSESESSAAACPAACSLQPPAFRRGGTAPCTSCAFFPAGAPASPPPPPCLAHPPPCRPAARRTTATSSTSRPVRAAAAAARCMLVLHCARDSQPLCRAPTTSTHASLSLTRRELPVRADERGREAADPQD